MSRACCARFLTTTARWVTQVCPVDSPLLLSCLLHPPLWHLQVSLRQCCGVSSPVSGQGCPVLGRGSVQTTVEPAMGWELRWWMTKAAMEMKWVYVYHEQERHTYRYVQCNRGRSGIRSDRSWLMCTHTVHTYVHTYLRRWDKEELKLLDRTQWWWNV